MAFAVAHPFLLFDPGGILLYYALLIPIIFTLLFVAATARLLSRPRLSRYKRYTRTIYHIRVRRLPGIRPRKQREKPRRRFSLPCRRPSRRNHFGRRPSKYSRSLLRDIPPERAY